MLADESTWSSVYLWFVMLNHDIANEAKTPETMYFFYFSLYEISSNYMKLNLSCT